MKRRLVLGTLLAGLVVVPAIAPVSAAVDTPHASSGSSTWVCVIVEHVNLGICQGNPLPDGPIVNL